MTEPQVVVAEPVGGNPIGASGMPTGTTEPAKTVSEPASVDDEIDYDSIDFEDPETWPEKLRPAMEKSAKKMQASFTKKMQTVTKVGEELGKSKPKTEEEPNAAKENVKAYMASPEGTALKEVVEEMIGERLGTLPQDVLEVKIDKEVGAVVKKYGEDIVGKNFDEIQEAAKANPGVPLDYIVSNVLYAKAKEIGADEYKSKIVKKNQFSDPAPSTNSNVISTKDSGSWDEAFENAKKVHGF